jgi:aminoglycoside phosphotransferase (APT) family kinase protein
MNVLDHTRESVARTLRSDFPDLAIERVEIVAQGWDHVVAEVNGDTIFRLPRGVHNREKLSRSVHYETAVLRGLRNKLPLAIPEPIYVAEDESYFGYPKLSGVLAVDLLPQFDADDHAQLRADWVELALAIHTGIGADDALSAGVPRFDPAELLATADRVHHLPGIDPLTRDFARKTLSAARHLDRSGERHVLIHNDLHLLNILCDPATKRASGVLDWTDCCVGPLAREFSVWEWSHDDSLDLMAALYEQASGVRIDVEQARLWKHLEEISDLVEQTESGDLRGAESSARHIHQWAQAKGPA